MDLPESRTQHWGCFTTAEAVALGWSRSAIETARRHGTLEKLRPGVYVEAASFRARAEREQHMTRIAAEQLALGRRWLAARRSAAVVYDIPLIGTAPLVPQLLRARDDGRVEARDRHARVGALRQADRGSAHGLAVVSPARLVADIARAEELRNAVVVADAVLAAGVPREDLMDCLGEMSRWPGVPDARQVVEFANGLAESALESISRVAFHELGLPAPELQVEVWLGDRLLGRVDTLWRFANTIGEADGVAKFGATDVERTAAFKAAKKRQEWLEDVGFEVARWGWDDAWWPRGVLDARLLRAFERGRRQQLDPRVRLVPTTVADRLREAA